MIKLPQSKIIKTSKHLIKHHADTARKQTGQFILVRFQFVKKFRERPILIVPNSYQKILADNEINLGTEARSFFVVKNRKVENEIQEIPEFIDFGPQRRVCQLLGDYRVNAVIFHQAV